MPTPEQADAIVKLGVAGILALGLLAYALGFVRVGKLVDADATRERAERDKRESQLIAERDVWMARSLASDKVVEALVNQGKR